MSTVNLNCEGCGSRLNPATMPNQKTIKCDYCGSTSANPLLGNQQNAGQQGAQQQNFAFGQRPLGTPPVGGAVPPPTGQTPPPPQFVPKRPQMSGCALAALILFFWPGAIIYAVVVNSQQNDWDKKYGGGRR